MKNNVTNLIDNLLKESEITRNDIIQAIEKGASVQVEKPFRNGEEDGVMVNTVVPVDIDDSNVVQGTDDSGEVIEFTLDEVIDTIDEAITISGDNLMKVDADALGKAAEKTDVEITEDNYRFPEEGMEGDEDIYYQQQTMERDAELNNDLQNVTDQENEWIDPAGGKHSNDETDPAAMYEGEKENSATKQEMVLTNLKAWSTQLGVELGEEKLYGNTALTIHTVIGEKATNTFIYPDGTIKIAGHPIKAFHQFENLVNFFRDLEN